MFLCLPGAEPPKYHARTELKHKDDPKTVAIFAETCTGDVTVTMPFPRDEPSRVSCARAHFEPGARTAWHAHPLGQTLIVTERFKGGPIIEVHAGDVLLCPAKEKHRHDAAPRWGMTRIANATPRALAGTRAANLPKRLNCRHTA